MYTFLLTYSTYKQQIEIENVNYIIFVIFDLVPTQT